MAARESEIKQVLREHDLKVTGQRLELMKLLTSSTEHMDAEEIYLKLLQRKKSVSRATVYRSLDALVEEGLVDRLDFGDGRARYERNEGRHEHHDHLICTECGKVIEFFNLEIEAQQIAVCTEHGFAPTDHTMHIYGICADCQKAGGS